MISIDKPGTVVKLDAARWLHLFLRLARFFLHSLLFPLLPFPRLQPPLTLWLPAVTIPPYSPRCTIFLHHVTAHSLTSHSPVLDFHAPQQHKISPLSTVTLKRLFFDALGVGDVPDGVIEGLTTEPNCGTHRPQFVANDRGVRALARPTNLATIFNILFASLTVTAIIIFLFFAGVKNRTWCWIQGIKRWLPDRTAALFSICVSVNIAKRTGTNQISFTPYITLVREACKTNFQ